LWRNCEGLWTAPTEHNLALAAERRIASTDAYNQARKASLMLEACLTGRSGLGFLRRLDFKRNILEEETDMIAQ